MRGAELKTLASADIYKEGTIFDIGGNKYRLIAGVDYEAQVVRVKQVMTHAEYDRDKWKKEC
jgi:mRNA interferase HigB